jgi:hypothetical protein
MQGGTLIVTAKLSNVEPVRLARRSLGCLIR